MDSAAWLKDDPWGDYKKQAFPFFPPIALIVLEPVRPSVPDWIPLPFPGGKR
jgi:hypothetical protein